MNKHTTRPVTEISVRFGEWVKDRRCRSKPKISMEDLANRVGSGKSYIHGLENGHYNVTLTKANDIATALGLPLSKVLRAIEKETR